MKTLDEIEKIKSILPDYVSKDIEKRINDWLLSGGSPEDSYIHQQLNYAKKFLEI